MPGRTRPIEKFAEAAAKCSPEVDFSIPYNIAPTDGQIGRCLWQVCGGQLPEYQEGHVCPRIPRSKGLLHRKIRKAVF